MSGRQVLQVWCVFAAATATASGCGAKGLSPEEVRDRDDRDDDGHVDVVLGGDDCNDADPTVYPGASERVWTTTELWRGESYDGEVPPTPDWVAIALDSAGDPHVLYDVRYSDYDLEEGGDRLTYTSRHLGSWNESDAASQARAESASLAVSPDGVPYVAYREAEDEWDWETDPSVRLRWLEGGRWTGDVSLAEAHGLVRTSVAADEDGQVVTAIVDYGSITVRIGTRASSETYELDGTSARVGIDSSGRPHLVYGRPREIRHAELGPAGWSDELVAPVPPSSEPGVSPGTGDDLQLQIEPAGRIHVVWRESERGIVYASGAGVDWTVDVVDADGTTPTLALDRAQPVIAYQEADGVWLAEGGPGAWRKTPMAPGNHPALAIAPDGAARVVLASAGTTEWDTDCDESIICEHAQDYRTLVLAEARSPADGIDRDCDGLDEPPRCAIDEDGDGELAYGCGGTDCDDADAAVGRSTGLDRYGDGVDSDCSGEDGVDWDGDGAASAESGGPDCDDGNPAFGPDAADSMDDCVDQNCDGIGGPDDDHDTHLSIQCHGQDCRDDDPNSYPSAPDTVGDGIDQNCDGVDGVDADEDGFASTDTGGDDCDDTRQRHHPGAPDNPRLWVVESAQCCGVAEDAVSLALDAGTPRVSYRGSGHVSVASRVDDAWETEIVDDVPDQAASPVLVVDARGIRHVLYREGDADELRHASEVEGAWAHESVDAAGTPGTRVAAVADSSGALHVAEVDAWDRDALQYATNGSGAWVVETVDDQGAAGSGCSIALAPDGALHIAYAELGDEDLRHATNASGAWVVETVDAGARRAQDTSIAVGADGALHILYRVGAAGLDVDAQLWYATNESGAWATEVADDARDAGHDAHLVVEDGGVLQAAYVQDGHVTLAVRRDGTWTLEQVEGVDCKHVALAVEPFGVHLLACQNGASLDYASDRPVADDRDQNCDGVDGVDADGDGHASVESAGDDCDDGDPEVTGCPG